ncbi:MAG: PocR ligand-binding domain-containing protein [Nitrospirae bacterium]|uniref:PocR ligand-binding domain-containing protein n=1 Tax=Candidatus Magnetobacterium casense TaxID=1455061 RepID=UPI000697AF87|nr:PocR ligand-binding domain-containing protein [Candidatus Magnetobacterium casensis]MBF0336764.1 PocR ligand-binding domain-containing protein [Nitrospirota bacterium]
MTYKLSELFNIEELRGLFESFTRLTGAVTALLDIEGNVLIATGWQPICTGFHRMHPETAMRCRESDTALASMLKSGERYNVYRCKNGLVDVAVPIVIDGIHMGNLLTGQFFFAPPDVQYFARQAEEFGFDGDKYLEALARVPIFTEEYVRGLMDFLLRLAGQICGMGLARKQTLGHSERFFAYYMDSIDAYVYMKDRQSTYTFINKKTEDLFNVTRADLERRPYTDFDFFSEQMAQQLIENDRYVMQSGQCIETEEAGAPEGIENTALGAGYRYYLTFKFPLRDEKGNTVGVCGFSYDITGRKEAEESLKDALKEQEALIESIRETTVQLRYSEEELKRFFDLSIDMLCIADIDGYFRVVSPSFSKILGYTAVELKSGPFIEFVHPDDIEKTLNEIKKLSQGIQIVDFENRYLCKDGRYKHIQWRSSPVPEAGLTYATARDVTEQRQMAEAVKTERDKLMGIMDAMQDCIYIVSVDYDIEFVNAATLREFGEVNGRKCYEYFHDGMGQCPWCMREDVFAGESITWEWFCPKNNKTYSHFDTPLRNNDGSISKFTLLHDISEIKRAQLTMNRELDFQRAVAELLEALLSPDKDIVDISILVNRQAMRLTDSLHGHVSEIDSVTEEQVSHTLTEMMSDGQCNVDTRHRRLAFHKGKDGYNALWGHVLNTMQAFYTNDPAQHPAYKGCLPQGHIPLTRYLSVPAMVGDRLIGNIALANADRDYTDADIDIIKRLASIYALAVERKRLEDELKTLNVNLASLVREETAKRQMQEQMLIQQSKMASMGEMIGLIAHQWKQPLSAIAIIVQDLRDAYGFGELDKNYIDSTIESTMGQVTFMGKTIDDFRNFFKPSKQKVAFDVKNAIDELISMFSPIFTRNNIKVNIKVTSVLSLIANGYPNEFKQVILNILNNSKDAIISGAATGTSVQGQIELEIARPLERQGQIVISIRDNGGGIPADVKGRIFEPYFTTKGSEGTGIGLYMSKTIIEANMGGSLTVKNIPGGAEFTISLTV